MTNYQIGDFLIRIKNAALAKNKTVSTVATKEIVAAAKALQKAGFLSELKVEKGTISVDLAFSHKEPVILDLKLVSKPGRRIYLKILEIEAKRGPSVFLLSTPKGVLISKEAKKLRVGGEAIAEIW